MGGLADPLAGLSAELLAVEAVLADAVLECLVGNAEEFGRRAERALRSVERLADQVLFQVGKLDALKAGVTLTLYGAADLP